MKIKKDYIKSLIKEKSLKQRDVASAIGVEVQDWNNWMFRGVFPHFNKLKELAEVLGRDVSELTTNKLFTEPNENEQYENQRNWSTIETVPFYDLDARTAHAIFSKSEEAETPHDQIYIPGLAADFVIPYYGKEMSPLISNGDLIAIRKIEDYSFFNYGNIYLVTTPEQIITRYVKRAAQTNCILLCAESEMADDIEISVKKLTEVYLVVTIIKRQVI